MTRDRDHDKERDPDGFVDAKPRRDRTEERVGSWIVKAEKEFNEIRPLVTAGKMLKGDSCQTLEQRFSMDLEIIRSDKSITPEAWAKATLAERLHSLRELERRLAKSQGRDPCRVYTSVDKTVPEAERDEGYFKQVGRLGSHELGDAQGWYIHIDENLVTDDPTTGRRSDVRHVCEVLFEESRHAYQQAVVHYPNKHSEVSDSRRKVWEDAFASYETDATKPGGHVDNAIEDDAKTYASVMRNEVHGKDRKPLPT